MPERAGARDGCQLFDASDSIRENGGAVIEREICHVVACDMYAISEMYVKCEKV